MRCPFCGHLEDKVVDSRQSKDGLSIRRRRECSGCTRRFTSYERIEEVFPQVVKKDGTREDFDRKKVLQGVKVACNKLPISREQVNSVVDEVEKRLLEQNAREVPSDFVGSVVTEELRNLDPVAYIRFASVYRAFGDIQEFLKELRELEEDSDPEVDASHSRTEGDAPDAGEV